MTTVDLTGESIPAGTGTVMEFGPAVAYDDISRRVLAYWMMFILTAATAFIGAFIWERGSGDAAQVVSVFLTPIIGLVGTVLGFYFGGSQPTD